MSFQAGPSIPLKTLRRTVEERSARRVDDDENVGVATLVLAAERDKYKLFGQKKINVPCNRNIHPTERLSIRVKGSTLGRELWEIDVAALTQFDALTR